MRYFVLFTGFLFFFTGAVSGQEDSLSALPGMESMATASLKTKELSIDLTNPDDVELALKKIHTFRYLESITLDGEADETKLKKLFYRLSVLKNLASITLKENELTKIPESIANIKSLRSLTIEGNTNLDYNDLCASLQTVPLNQLSLIDNDLKKTPGNISAILTLKKLKLSGSNQLDYSELVEQLAKLPGLTTLSLPVNYITELPGNIDKLRSLQVLDVSDNNLMELPDEISALKTINNLSIHGNLMFDPAKDLEKLKDNNIRYLSLDKEISGEDLEQIKKLFPRAQVDFPISTEEEAIKEIKKPAEENPVVAPQVYSGNLRAKKESRILSPAYAFYPALFQNIAYGFDTLNFEERYKDLRYANTYQIVSNDSWRAGLIYFRKKTIYYEQPGKKSETWFRFASNDPAVASNYPEIRAFSGMYWVYKGELTKRQFNKKYIRRRRKPVNWNDMRVDFDKNNSLFTIQLKGDSSFVSFTAYPVIPDVAIERCQQTYNRRFISYKKALLRRSQSFNRNLARTKSRYDFNYKKVKDYAWNVLQLRMSNEEKAMKQEEWLDYYDNIIAHEQKAIDNTALLSTYILRGLSLRGYNVPANDLLSPVALQNRNTRIFNVDFVSAADTGKLAVANILVVDNKNKTVLQLSGTLGLLPNAITLQQYASYTLLVELRNGNWGYITAEEIDKYSFEPNKTYQFSTLVFDKNLDTIGDLLKKFTK